MTDVKHVDARKHRAGEDAKKRDRRESEELAMRAQQGHRAERVGAAPVDRSPPFARQRFRQHAKAVRRVEESQHRGRPKRKPWVHAAEYAADRGPEDEAEPERRA